MVLGGVWITDLPSGIRALGTGAIVGIPVCIWVAALVAAAALVLARCTPLGVRIRAVGGNSHAAALAGISVTRVKLLTFALLGALTGVAALVSVPQQSVIESGIGAGFELVVVTAVVVGGTSIRGGRGGIIGTLLAACLLGSIRTILVFVNLGEMATYWERAIQGACILAAVLSDHFSSARAPVDEAAGEHA
jgi:ribose/xylose/arabinose/galactoside ABC-type transport system permease subunit